MWPNSDETQELLRNAEGGDAEAIEALLDRHRTSIQQLVRMRMDRAVAQRVDASDVVQDVLLEASLRLDDFIQAGKMPFHLWLRQLAKDRIIDMHRRHRGAQRRSVDREQSMVAPVPGDQSSIDLAAQLMDQELTPAAENMRRELEQTFLSALSQLNDDDREIIVMRHYEHLSNSDIAEAMGISQASAGMKHLRALRKLRAILGDSSSSGEDSQ